MIVSTILHFLDINTTVTKENRAADIRLYITDNTNVTARTGWKPELGVRDIVTDIHAWLDENRGALEPILK